MVGRVGREADQLALEEDRDDDGDVGRVAGAVVRVVVDNHVALVPFTALQAPLNAGQIAGQRTDMQRRRFRFAQGIEIHVEQAGAQVL